MDTKMTPDSEPTAPPPGPDPLTRSRHDRMIAGVAGGIARKYDFDPALVRVAFVVIAILTYGLGVVAYAVAWLVVPEANVDEPVLSAAVRNARRHAHGHAFDKRFVLGLVLIALGANALADRAGIGLPRFSHVFWPMALIGGGAAILLLRDRNLPAPEPPPRPGWAPPPVPTSSTPSDGSPQKSASDESEGADATAFAATAARGWSLPLPPPAPPGFPPTAYPPSPAWPVPPVPPVVPRRARRERSMLGRLTWSVLLVVAGVAWLVDLTGVVGVDVRVVIAIELAVVGLALLVGTWFGRARGLITLGLLLTFVAGALSIIDVPVRGPIGERVVRPSAIADLDARYRLAIGHLELDLTDTTLDAHSHRVVLTDAIGFLDVVVPAHARVEVIARADAGNVSLFDRADVGGTHVRRVVYDEPPGTSGPLLVIDAHVGFGQVSVTRTERVSG